MNSQNEQILNHLKKGNPIDSIAALNMFGCFRLAARIDNLKNAGHLIISETINRNGKRYSQYRLAK